jgi:hypothetical protein
MNYPAYSYTVYTNEFGFRDKSTGSRDLKAASFCVFLGASDVFGNGVNYEDSFAGIFAEEALKKGFGTLNLAVGGHFFLDREALLKDFIENTKYKPSTIFYSVNALGIPTFDRRNQNVIVKNGYAIDRDGWRLAYLRLLAGNTSAAYCFFRDAVRRIQERHMQREVTEKSFEFLQVYSKQNAIRQPERLRLFEEHLEAFESFCRQTAIDLVYVFLPLSDSFRVKDIAMKLGLDPDEFDPSFYEDVMREHCERNKIPLVNVQPDLERANAEGHELRFKSDPHYNKYANRLVGECLIRDAIPLLRR